MRQGKNWGYTTEFFHDATNSAHHLEIRKGGYCSEHRHEHKHNLFYVVSGELKLVTWSKEEARDITILGPGQSAEISPGFWHFFEGITSVNCIEIYRVLLTGEDIERRTEGGLR